MPTKKSNPEKPRDTPESVTASAESPRRKESVPSGEETSLTSSDISQLRP